MVGETQQSELLTACYLDSRRYILKQGGVPWYYVDGVVASAGIQRCGKVSLLTASTNLQRGTKHGMFSINLMQCDIPPVNKDLGFVTSSDLVKANLHRAYIHWYPMEKVTHQMENPTPEVVDYGDAKARRLKGVEVVSCGYCGDPVASCLSFCPCCSETRDATTLRWDTFMQAIRRDIHSSHSTTLSCSNIC